jgi:hypothetical protein
MVVPSQMSTRQFPPSFRLRLRMAHAAAWESLIATHTAQAMQFIHEFAPRLPVLGALDLYLRVVAVPGPMEEAVRSRALSGIELAWLPPRIGGPATGPRPWSRLDLLLKHVRSRHRFQAETLELARLVGARAADEVLDTHVTNVLNLAQLLSGHLSLERTVAHYTREFDVSEPVAAWVKQRAQAELASEHLAERANNPNAPPTQIAGLVVGYPAPDGG